MPGRRPIRRPSGDLFSGLTAGGMDCLLRDKTRPSRKLLLDKK